MLYKNISNSAKTFYGVTFKPGETKEVNGYINHNRMIVVDKIEEPAKQQKPSSDKPKKAEEKPEGKEQASKEKNEQKSSEQKSTS